MKTLHLIDAPIYVFRAYYSMPPNFYDEEGNLVAEGDMILGNEKDLGEIESRGIAHVSPFRRWPNATIPYKIQAGHPMYSSIIAAIKEMRSVKDSKNDKIPIPIRLIPLLFSNSSSWLIFPSS